MLLRKTQDLNGVNSVRSIVYFHLPNFQSGKSNIPVPTLVGEHNCIFCSAKNEHNVRNHSYLKTVGYKTIKSNVENFLKLSDY